MSLNGSAQSIGSPSRMRGKEGDELGLGQTIRITPAYAGKSGRHALRHVLDGDHPCVCGEKDKAAEKAPHLRGSPPRMRGKAVFPARQHRTAGITPACAGKSRSQPRLPCTGRDHPRACGEKSSLFRTACSPMGSPPRMRGKALELFGGAVVDGITPAYAGKRGRCCPDKLRCWDHPRVCGEKFNSRSSADLRHGSPPHVRGKAVPVAAVAVAAGITPACAGKSGGLPCRVHRRGDHPRVCGEKCPPGKFFFMTVGSPPRMRGKVPSSI